MMMIHVISMLDGSWIDHHDDWQGEAGSYGLGRLLAIAQEVNIVLLTEQMEIV